MSNCRHCVPNSYDDDHDGRSALLDWPQRDRRDSAESVRALCERHTTATSLARDGEVAEAAMGCDVSLMIPTSDRHQWDVYARFVLSDGCPNLSLFPS